MLKMSMDNALKRTDLQFNLQLIWSLQLTGVPSKLLNFAKCCILYFTSVCQRLGMSSRHCRWQASSVRLVTGTCSSIGVWGRRYVVLVRFLKLLLSLKFSIGLSNYNSVHTAAVCYDHYGLQNHVCFITISG